jgi:predicted RNase H-like nuclease (RuvC/YqgF family)
MLKRDVSDETSPEVTTKPEEGNRVSAAVDFVFVFERIEKLARENERLASENGDLKEEIRAQKGKNSSLTGIVEGLKNSPDNDLERPFLYHNQPDVMPKAVAPEGKDRE